MRSLAPDIRFFVKNKAIGLFEQGDSGSSCGDFVELRAWLLAHLMWDPARDEDVLVAEFLDGYYGAAAGPLREYLDLVHGAVQRSGAYLPCYLEDTSSWLGVEDLKRAAECFDKAQQAVATDAELSHRVRRARMPLDHAWLQRYHSLKRATKIQGAMWSGPADPAAFCEYFIQTAHAFGVGSYAEGRPFSDLEPLLRARFRPPAPAPEICKGLPEEDWLDIQDNEFSLSGLGNWTTSEDDPKASDGRGARMPAVHHEWAVQYPVSGDVSALGPAHTFVSVRCKAKAASGPAFTVGIYDTATKSIIAQKAVTIDETGGDAYRDYDLGVHALTSDMYIWVAPAGNPDEVEAVFVDRMFWIR
jgi:hypothetical protein